MTFFKILTLAFQGRWGRLTYDVEFWGCDLKILQLFQKVWLLTSSSKVLIYLNLLYFIFYCTLVSIVKGNIAKSNKSELRNCLSYKGLPYLFEVRCQTFSNNCKILRSQPQDSTSIIIRPYLPRKAQVRIFKKCIFCHIC